MPAVIGVVLPVFGLIAVGFLARWTKLLGDLAGEGLSGFVYTLAIPCLIFRTLARAHIPDVQPWGYWISYFVAVAIVWSLATLIARRIFDLDPMAATVAGFATGQANTVLVGIPMILKAYGDEGAVPLFLLIAIHLPITMTAATVLAEGRGASPLAILRRLATHPIVIGVLLGSLVRWLPPAITDAVWPVVDPIGNAAVSCALVGMGIALKRYGLEGGLALPAIIAALKLVVHPLIVWLLAFHVFSMPPAWAGVAVLFASAPSGINAYLFAERYKSGVAIASSAIALSTGFAVLTTIMWLLILGVG
jgi:predicted permease